MIESAWNKNNRAHKSVWFTLYVLDQNNRPFWQSGTVTMDGLTFWKQSASADIRMASARSLAIQLHNNFTMIRRANLEDGRSVSDAINAMVTILINKDATIAELANVIDEYYRFLGEEDEYDV